MQCPNCRGEVAILYEHAEETLAHRFLRWRCKEAKAMCEFCGHDPCQCDLDQNNPVDADADTWARIYADPDYDADHDHSMDY